MNAGKRWYMAGFWTAGLILAAIASQAPAAVMLGDQPDPSEPSLQLWLKADALALSNGATVSPWTASAGSNAVLASGTPTYIASSSSFNGKPVVRFDGVDDGFNLSVTTASTVVIVAKYNDPAPTGTEYLFSGNPFTGVGPWSYAGHTNDVNYWEWFNNAVYATSTNAYDTLPHITFHEVENTFTDPGVVYVDTVRVIENGTTLLTGTHVDSSGVTPIVSLGFNQLNDYASADIAEVLVYDRILTSGEKADLQAYLTAKYVPEPTSLVLLASGGLMLLRRRDRRAARVTK